MRKILAALIVALLIICNIPVSAESEIIIDSYFIDETGVGEVYGYITEYDADTQVTFLAVIDDGSGQGIISSDTIIALDQITVGNNGAFLFEFYIASKFSANHAVLRVGTSSGAEAVTIACDMPTIPPGIENVPSNSVIYGVDVYKVESIYLTSEYVSDSIIYGGNKIYYKLGGMWYNLLSSEADTAAYLVPENAVSNSVMKSLDLRYYYGTKRRLEFAEGGV